MHEPVRLVLVGGGGNLSSSVTYLREALQAEARRAEVLGVLDDDRPDPGRLASVGLRHLGPLSLAPSCGATAYVLGAGMPSGRRILAEQIASALEPWTVLHPGAAVASGAQIGAGCQVHTFTTVAAGVRLGRQVLVGSGAAMGEGAVVGAYGALLPLSAIGCRARLGDGVMVGARAVIADGVSVGDGASVGARAVVLDDVEPGVTVAGIPARPVGSRSGS